MKPRQRRDPMPLLYLGVGLLVALGIWLAGCAGGVDGVRQGVASTAGVVTAGYRAIAKVDEVKQLAILAHAKAGDVKGAEADLASYRVKRNLAIKVLDDASAVIESAVAILPALESKGAAQWIANLIGAALKVREALAAIGVGI